MSDENPRPAYITVWRKTGKNALVWDNFPSLDLTESRTVVQNLKKQGVTQYATYKIEERVDELSSEY